MTITLKINVEKLIFHSVQPIIHLSCKFEHFWKKKNFRLNIEQTLKNKNKSSGWIFFTIISRNRLVSTAYFATISSAFYMQVDVSIKINQNWPNLHERCGTCWIDRKMIFQIFIFRVMVIFFTKNWQIPMKFHDNSKK